MIVLFVYIIIRKFIYIYSDSKILLINDLLDIPCSNKIASENEIVSPYLISLNMIINSIVTSYLKNENIVYIEKNIFQFTSSIYYF